jgi:hypothetical protein
MARVGLAATRQRVVIPIQHARRGEARIAATASLQLGREPRQIVANALEVLARRFSLR